MINLDGPEGEFSFAVDGQCMPVEAHFVGLSEGAYDYYWDFGNGSTDSTGADVFGDSVVHLYETPGSFQPVLILIDGENCLHTLAGDSIHVTGDFVDAGDDLVHCAGDEILLTPALSAGLGWWSQHPGIVDTTQMVQNITLDSTASFVFVGAYNSCIETDTVFVTIEQHSEVSAQDMTICVGDSVVLSGQGNVDWFEWQESDGLPLVLDSVGKLKVAPSETATYRLIGARSPCPPDTTMAQVEVLGNFNYQIDHQYIVYPNEVFPVPLEVDDMHNLEISWSPAYAVSCSTCEGPSVETDSSMMLYFEIVEPFLGCSMTDSLRLYVPRTCSDAFAYVPNTFTPNYDGVNDHLEISTRKYEHMEFFGVYDRWGNLVYDTDDIGFKWNGERNGQVLDPGVYVYSLQLVCPMDGSLVHKTGDITILR